MIMSISRKRYRPLDLVEEREIKSNTAFTVEILEDEKSYCFSWPDTPLSSTLAPMYLPTDSKNTSSYNLCLPPLLTVFSDAMAVGREEVQEILRQYREGGPIWIRKSYPAVSDCKGATNSCISEDTIFSLSAEELEEARNVGLLYPQSNEADQQSSWKDDICMRKDIESFVVELEWRAFREAEHTAAALQRLLPLEAAVPFNPLSNVSESHCWRRKVYDLWVRWRTRGKDTRRSAETQRWGSPLLPGAYLYGVQQDYFLDSGVRTSSSRSLSKSHARVQSERMLSAPPRQTVYNFLMWKVERSAVTLRPGEGHHFSLGSVLTPEQVEGLLHKVLHQSFQRVEVEESRTETGIELSDLKSEMKTWRNWLEKV